MPGSGPRKLCQRSIPRRRTTRVMANQPSPKTNAAAGSGTAEELEREPLVAEEEELELEPPVAPEELEPLAGIRVFPPLLTPSPTSVRLAPT